MRQYARRALCKLVRGAVGQFAATTSRATGLEPACMGALFQVGYEMALHGYPWQKSSPEFAEDGEH